MHRSLDAGRPGTACQVLPSCSCPCSAPPPRARCPTPYPGCGSATGLPRTTTTPLVTPSPAPPARPIRREPWPWLPARWVWWVRRTFAGRPCPLRTKTTKKLLFFFAVVFVVALLVPLPIGGETAVFRELTSEALCKESRRVYDRETHKNRQSIGPGNKLAVRRKKCLGHQQWQTWNADLDPISPNLLSIQSQKCRCDGSKKSLSSRVYFLHVFRELPVVGACPICNAAAVCGLDLDGRRETSSWRLPADEISAFPGKRRTSQEDPNARRL